MPFVTFDGLAGWLHPARRAPTGLAVLLCGPFGDDAYGTYQGWRVLADMLAVRGIPALRFDWPGTGDSAGMLPEAGIMDGWTDSAAAAAAYMRHATGTHALALVGLRLGALLAAYAAPRLGGIEAMALLAQPASGRALMRELRLVHQISTLSHAAPGQGLDVAGLALSAAAVREIEELRAPAAYAADRVLLASTRPAAALPGHAIAIPFDGYDAFMQDNLVAEVPAALFGHVVAWIDQPGMRSVAGAPTLAPAEMIVPGGRETPVWFGPDRGLFGILCTPDQPRDDAPATVLLGSGATHHVGNGRINVLLARHLVGLGVTTLRMASPGAGENTAMVEMQPYAPELPAGASAAIDCLAGRGYRRFAAFGLCSGGYVAFHAARADPRLSALILLNLQVFDWRPGDPLVLPVRAQAAYAKAIRSGQVWRRVIGRDGDRLTLRRGLRVGAILVWRRLTRLRERMRRQRPNERATPHTILGWLRALGAGGCRVLLVWGDADPGLDAARGAFGPRLKRANREPSVTTSVLPGAQHVLNSRASQQAFLDLAAAYLLAQACAASSPPAATNDAASNTIGDHVTYPPPTSSNVLSTGVANAKVPSSRGSPRFIPTSHSTNAAPSGPTPISPTIAQPRPSGMTGTSVTAVSTPANTADAAQKPAIAPSGTFASRRDSTE